MWIAVTKSVSADVPSPDAHSVPIARAADGKDLQKSAEASVTSPSPVLCTGDVLTHANGESGQHAELPGCG